MLEHRFAQLAAFCTALLLVIGGTVNPTGSSLACPEAVVVCHGQLFPEMTGGVLYEHGHRLAAMTIGMLQIGLTILLLSRRRRMGALAVGTLIMVIVQGALGALTVYAKLPWYVSTAHLLLGFTYCATLLYIAWRTRPNEAAARDAHARPDRLARLGGARAWVTAATGMVVVQLLLGALVRHHEATLACVGMPACTVGPDPSWFPASINERLHMVHRGFGVLVGIVTVAAAIAVWRRSAGWTAMRRLMLAAPVLVAAQITLGIYVVLTFRSTPVAVAHFAGAVALWALWITAFLMTRGPVAVADARRGAASSAPSTSSGAVAVP